MEDCVQIQWTIEVSRKGIQEILCPICQSQKTAIHDYRTQKRQHFSSVRNFSFSHSKKDNLYVHALKKDVLKPMTLRGAISVEPKKIFSVFFMPEKASVPSKALQNNTKSAVSRYNVSFLIDNPFHGDFP